MAVSSVLGGPAVSVSHNVVADTLFLAMADGALGAFTEYQRRRGLMPTTIDSRRRALERAERWLPCALAEATTADLEAWLHSAPLSAQSQRWAISTLSCFFDFAIRDGYAEENPARRLERPRLRRHLPRPITDVDLRQALHYAEPIMYAWLVLAALAGLRCGEIAGLEGQDVLLHLAPPILVVTKAKGLRERTVPLHPKVATALVAGGLPPRGPVFRRRRDGQAHSPTRVSQQINAYLHELGIGATAHQLRHYFASSLYRDTRDIRLVQELLGHASPTTTAIYCAWSPSDAAVAVRKLAV